MKDPFSKRTFHKLVQACAVSLFEEKPQIFTFLCGELKYFPVMIKNNGTYGNPTFRLKGITLCNFSSFQPNTFKTFILMF